MKCPYCGAAMTAFGLALTTHALYAGRPLYICTMQRRLSEETKLMFSCGATAVAA